MSIILFKENFDTDIFKKNVYKMLLTEDVEKFSLFKKISEIKEKNNMICCFTVFSNTNINSLKALDFDLVSIRNTYLYKGGRFKKGCKDMALKVYSSKEKLPILDDYFLKENILNLSNTSRYSNDKKIDSKNSYIFYKTWLENSFYNGYSDEFFLIFKDNDLVGLVTIKIKDGNGYIDLIGVLPKFQKLGLGRLLLEKSLDFFSIKNIKDIYVITEAENIGANIFYQKNNFILNKVELVYHKHY